MNVFKQMVKRAKDKARTNDESKLAACFGTKEAHGDLYLTYNGIAFHKVTPDTQTKDVVDMLNKAREAAIRCALG